MLSVLFLFMCCTTASKYQAGLGSGLDEKSEHQNLKRLGGHWRDMEVWGTWSSGAQQLKTLQVTGQLLPSHIASVLA